MFASGARKDFRRSAVRGLATLVVLLLAWTGVVAVPSARAATVSPVVDRTAQTVTAQALPTVQIDGIVWAQTMIGNTVYAVGKFANARPDGAAPGVDQTRRNNILAYDIRTGDLVPGFDPNVNGEIKSIVASPDKTRLYIGGLFTTVGGRKQAKLAAISPSTGRLVTTFLPQLNGTVTAIAATSSLVYVGGAFNASGTKTRKRLAAFGTAKGGLNGWAPTADSDVTSMVLAPGGGKLVVGGKFQHIGTTRAQGVTALSLSSGAVLTWKVNTVIKNGNTQSGTYSLSADRDTVFGTSFNYGTGNYEGLYATRPQDGSIVWLADCHGDTYAALSMGGVVYGAGHSHFCSNIGGFPERSPRWSWRAMAFTKAATGTVLQNGQLGKGYGNFAGRPSPSIVYWFPQFATGTVSGLSQAVWSLTGNGRYLSAGGEFPSVNARAHQGLVRFAIPGTIDHGAAVGSSGPTSLGGTTNPTVTAVDSSQGPSVTLTWTANWDRDDRQLTYRVVRSDLGPDAPVAVIDQSSSFWDRPTLTVTDDTVEPGTTYRYRVYEYDAGQLAAGTPGTYSDNVSVTTP